MNYNKKSKDLFFARKQYLNDANFMFSEYISL